MDARFSLGDEPPESPRSAREAGLDRLRAVREVEGGRSDRMKRLGVAAVCGCLGVGALQGWLVLQLLAIPAALLFWWLDDRIAVGEAKLARLYEAVQAGTAEPPLMGEEQEVAAALPEEGSTPLLRVPGAGLHFMMLAIAILFTLLL